MLSTGFSHVSAGVILDNCDIQLFFIVVLHWTQCYLCNTCSYFHLTRSEPSAALYRETFLLQCWCINPIGRILDEYCCSLIEAADKCRMRKLPFNCTLHQYNCLIIVGIVFNWNCTLPTSQMFKDETEKRPYIQNR